MTRFPQVSSAGLYRWIILNCSDTVLVERKCQTDVTSFLQLIDSNYNTNNWRKIIHTSSRFAILSLLLDHFSFNNVNVVISV